MPANYPGIGEVIVGLKGRVQRGNQMEQRSRRDGVAQDGVLVARVAAPAQVRRHVGEALRRRQRLQIAAVLVEREALVQRLLGADHFARVALDASGERGVAGSHGQRAIQRLKLGVLQQLHVVACSHRSGR